MNTEQEETADAGREEELQDGGETTEEEGGEDEEDAGEEDSAIEGETGTEAQGNGGTASGRSEDPPSATDSPTDGYLKIIITVRNGKTVVGVERTYADPYLESVPSTEVETIAAEIPGIVERATERWDHNPKYPNHFQSDQKKKKKTTTPATAQPPADTATKTERAEIHQTPMLL